MAKQKRHLTKSEEFDIMKIVLDKFLLLGIIIIAMGLYMIVSAASISYGFIVLATGAFIMIIFAMILVKEYNFLEH